MVLGSRRSGHLVQIPHMKRNKPNKEHLRYVKCEICGRQYTEHSSQEYETCVDQIIENSVNCVRGVMKPLLSITAVAAIILGVFSYQWLHESHLKATTQTAVILAAHDLAPGTVIEMTDLEEAKIGLAQLPKNAPRHNRDIVGHVVTVPIARGQIILTSQVSPDQKPNSTPSQKKPKIARPEDLI
jgi:hypothetical protein